MALSLSDVKFSDIALLVRSIDYPAMQDGPLYRIMFNAILRDEERENIVKWICQEADQHKRHMYVLASPAGVYLYAKFDFETVGQIDTGKGVITSMLRKSR